MALASSLRKAAVKLLNAVGGDVTIRKVTNGAYNPTTGATNETVSDTVVKGFIEDVKAEEVNDLQSVVKKRLTIAASSLTYVPVTTDRVVIGGVVHQIVSIKTEEQNNTAISYEMQLKA
jgi:hypothetical protein